MHGYQLVRARQLLRMQLRHVATTGSEIANRWHALDQEDLFDIVAPGNGGSRGNVLRLVLLARGLRGLGISESEIPRALSLSPAELGQLEAIPLFDPEHGGATIEARILAELPETRDRGPWTAAAAALNQQPPA